MILTDLNGNLKPPANFALVAVKASGGFLVLEYAQAVFSGADLVATNYVSIFVNDQSREVIRTTWSVPVVEQTMDWSMNAISQQAGHQPEPLWKEYWNDITSLWRKRQ